MQAALFTSLADVMLAGFTLLMVWRCTFKGC